MSAVAREASTPTAADPKLRRTLGVVAVLAVAVATGAPSEGVAINPQGAAGLVGRAIPLTLIIAVFGVFCVWYGFIRLSQYFNHAGSAYALAGATLGPRAGVVAGWTLFGAYSAYAIINFMGTGIFGAAFLNDIGIHVSGTSAPWIIGAIGALGACALAVLPIRVVGRTLFSAEVATVVLILILTAIVLIKIIAGSAPDGQPFTLNMFTLPSGVHTSDLFLGVVFGFLYFAGFESAATLGEETENPRKNIPRALLAVAALGAVFFIFTVSVLLMGYGTDANGIKNLLAAPSTIGVLADNYVGTWLGTIVTFGIGLGKVHPRTGTPMTASVVVLVFGLVVGLVIRVLWTNVPLELFAWVASTGTLGLLVVYLMVTFGTMRFLFFSEKRLAPMYELAVPIAAVIVVCYTLYRSIFPVPDGPARYFPYVAGAWILIAVVVVFAAPSIARGVGERLSRDEGIVDADAEARQAAAVGGVRPAVD
jgi:amino acid transporter